MLYVVIIGLVLGAAWYSSRYRRLRRAVINHQRMTRLPTRYDGHLWHAAGLPAIDSREKSRVTRLRGANSDGNGNHRRYWQVP